MDKMSNSVKGKMFTIMNNIKLPKFTPRAPEIEGQVHYKDNIRKTITEDTLDCEDLPIQQWELDELNRNVKMNLYTTDLFENSTFLYEHSENEKDLAQWQVDNWFEDIILDAHKEKAKLKPLHQSYEDQPIIGISKKQASVNEILPNPTKVPQDSASLVLSKPNYRGINFDRVPGIVVKNLRRLSTKAESTNVFIDIDLDPDIVLYESSEQHAPRPMIPGMLSYSRILQHKSQTGLHTKQALGPEKQLGKELMFLGLLQGQVQTVEGPDFVNVLENRFFRVPIFEHQVLETDFLLSMAASGQLRLRMLNRLMLAGKQMPIQLIPCANSWGTRALVTESVLHHIRQKGYLRVSTLQRLQHLFRWFSVNDDLHKILTLTNDSTGLIIEPHHSHRSSHYTIADYYDFLTVLYYLFKFDYHESTKKYRKRQTGAAIDNVNQMTPWRVAESYLKVITECGFFDLRCLAGDLRQNQMSSFWHTDAVTHKASATGIKNKEKIDLRTLTKYQFRRIIEDIDGAKLDKGKSRWDLCHNLTTKATFCFDKKYDKYSKQTKKNLRPLKVGYLRKRQEVFVEQIKLLSNPNRIFSFHDRENPLEQDLAEFNNFIKKEITNPVTAVLPPDVVVPPGFLGTRECLRFIESLGGSGTNCVYVRKYKVPSANNGAIKATIAAADVEVSETQLGPAMVLELRHHLAARFTTTKSRHEVTTSLRSRKFISQLRKSGTTDNKLSVLPANSTTTKACRACGNRGHISTNKICPVKLNSSTTQFKMEMSSESSIYDDSDLDKDDGKNIKVEKESSGKLDTSHVTMEDIFGSDLSSDEDNN